MEGLQRPSSGLEILHCGFSSIPSANLVYAPVDRSQIGIIGMGNIGSLLANMCASLGMKIIYSNRRPKPSSPHEYVTLDELYRRSDAIVLTCPLTEETRYLINKDSLGRMKDGVVLVNVGK
jgi:lactate dehydrogenase-like 2-hydroxyacid dehydrogenase